MIVFTIGESQVGKIKTNTSRGGYYHCLRCTNDLTPPPPEGSNCIRNPSVFDIRTSVCISDEAVYNEWLVCICV